MMGKNGMRLNMLSFLLLLLVGFYCNYGVLVVIFKIGLDGFELFCKVCGFIEFMIWCFLKKLLFRYVWNLYG